MTSRVPAVLLVATVTLAWTISCTEHKGPEPSERPQPKASANLCQTLGRESLDRLVPGGEPEAETDDYDIYTETTCSVSSPVDTSTGSRTLWVERNRYTETGGRTADENCREAMRSSKLQNADDWRHGSATELSLRLGDVTEAQVRSVRYDAEAEILLCRAGVYVRVHFQADEADKEEVAGEAEGLARDLLPG